MIGFLKREVIKNSLYLENIMMPANFDFTVISRIFHPIKIDC